MKLTKLIALMLIVVLSCTALVSCGDNELETSVFSVKSSSDWEITKRKVDGKEKEDQVYVLKGGADANSCPGLLISYFSDPSQYKDEKGFYKDAKDVSSISAHLLTFREERGLPHRKRRQRTVGVQILA